MCRQFEYSNIPLFRGNLLPSSLVSNKSKNTVYLFYIDFLSSEDGGSNLLRSVRDRVPIHACIAVDLNVQQLCCRNVNLGNSYFDNSIAYILQSPLNEY
jgi:hypothetical protein